MEEWEVLIDQYKSSTNCKTYENAIQVAQTVCEKDLAPFEIDWFLESLLKKPVELLKTVTNKRNEDEWTKALENSFSLLSIVIEKLQNAEPYYEDVGKLCTLTYTARVAAKALDCLTQLARRHCPSASEVQSQEEALCYNDTCKAVRIGLLGVLCEYHPELFSDVSSLWRTFINLLDAQGSKVSLNVVKAVLEAVCGLFKNFGTDLVVSELYEFYDKMAPFLDQRFVDDGRTKKKCHEACCVILEKYSDLFKERVSADIELRSNLWNTLTVATRPTVIAVYRTCFKDGAHLQQITTELIHKAGSNYPLARYTALRILSEASRDVTAPADMLANMFANMLASEHAPSLASRLPLAVDYDTAEAIAWCIYADVLYSDRLLQASILHYDTFPTSMRKRAVVYNILEATSGTRVPAIAFLIAETCTTQDAKRKDVLMSLWKDLFDSNRGTDLVVLENSQKLFEDYLEHVVFVLDTFLLEDLEELPPKISALLKLTAYILKIQDIVNNMFISSLYRLVEMYTRTYPCAEVVCLVRACGVVEEESVLEAYKYINISTCVDEEHLLETCLALIEAPSLVDSRQVLLAAKILLSNPDTEAEILSKTLKKLEHVILVQNQQFDEPLINEIVCLVEKIRKRNNSSSKHERILHRDAVMFLSKFGSYDMYNKVHSTDDVLIAGLKELCLNVPIPYDSSTLKLNLHGVLEQAIDHKDSDVLETVITVICANSRSLDTENISGVVSVALAAASRRTALASRAAPLCGRRVAAHLLQYILKETSPQARKALLEALEVFLTTGTHVQISELADNIIMVCDVNCASHSCQGKLDLLSTLIRALKENNLLSQKHLPHVVIQVLKTQLPKTRAVFDDVTTMFIDKISLFDINVITTLYYDVLNCLSSNEFKINAKSKKLVVCTVSFLMRLNDLVLHLPDMVEVFDASTRDVTPQVLVLLSRLRCGFDCQLTFCRDYVFRKAEFFDKLLDATVAIESEMEYLCAILDFVATFSDVILEVHYEKTLHLLSKIIESLTPVQIQHIHTNLSNCMFSIRKQLKSVPQILNISFTKWFRGLPLVGISSALSKCDYVQHTAFIVALECMLAMFEVNYCPFLMELCKLAQQWLGYVRGEDRYAEFAKDLHSLVRICVMVLPVDSVRDIVFRDKDDTLKFCQTFIGVFSDFFILNHSVFSGEHCKYAAILNDVVRYRVKSGRTEGLLAAVNEIWPVYEVNSTFKQKHTLLLDISRLTSTLPPESNPMQWLIITMASNVTSREDKIRLLSVVPGGEAYSSTYRQFASNLPTRLSELNAVTSAALQALLDNFAATRDTIALDIVASLADGDATKGWWDQAMDVCMKELASTADIGLGLLKALYTATWEGRTVGVCERLLVPLLRYSPPTLCEEFFSTVLEELFSVLKKRPREVAANSVYQKCVLDYTRAFNILRIAFEKIPKQHLESTESLLYSKLESKIQKPFLIVYNICVFGVELRRKIACPVQADALKDIIRMFHCSALNCMATALCCRNPKPEIYATVFGVDVWSPTVDCDTTYHLPLTEEWRELTTRQAVSIDISDGEHSFLSAGTHSRTAHFVGTLSENPFLYDLPEVDEIATTQELTLTDNPLNQHECAATLTALFCRAATWRNLVEKICEALNGGPVNMRWLLAQIVCNCKEELKQHAMIIRPALFTLILNTTEDSKLNRLHMEILKTIIYWREETHEIPDASIQDFNNVIKCIIITIKDYRNRHNIVNSVTDKLYQLCDMFGRYVQVKCEWFDTSSNPNVGQDTKQIELKILKVFAKTKVDMTVLIPKIFEIFETGLNDLNIEVPKLFGMVLNTVGSDTASGYVAKFRGLVDGLRRSSLATYIKVVYYTQMGYPGCCDEKIIREIIDLVYKIPGREKLKCLDIIATYLSFTSPGQHVNELFDMLDISQLLLNGQGLNIVVKGLPLMEETLRRRVVKQVVDGKWPPSAEGDVIDVMVEALEVSLQPTSMDEPPSKKRSTVSPLLSKELQSVISRLTAGLTDQDVLNRVADCMSKDFAARFCEAFAIAVYSPAVSSKHDITHASYLVLELFFHELRRQDGFKAIRLSDKPLEYGEQLQANTSKTSTKSLTQFSRQGTDVKDAKHQVPLDVQMSIEDVLKSILAFAKSNQPVADELCLQVARSTRSATTDATICDFLLPLLESNPTPFVVELCRVYVDRWCNIEGFQKAIEDLVKRCTGTEGYDLVVTLHQDMVLRSHKLKFIMGSYDKYEEFDLQVLTLLFVKHNRRFLDNDSISNHGKLSNLDDLTFQQRENVVKKLSRIWTDEETFKNSLEKYEGGVEWLDAMLSVYRNDGRCYQTSRLLKKLDAWPRNSFDVAAVAEAIEWQQIKQISHTEEDLYKLTCSIAKNDCLAKWATRLMIRRLFLKTLDVEQNSDASERTIARSLSLSHQLQWCKSANERGLPTLARQCLDDVSGLYESETLKWLEQKIIAVRALNTSSDNKKEELQLYDYSKQFQEMSSLEDIARLEYQRLLIFVDLKYYYLDMFQNLRDIISKCLIREKVSMEFKKTVDSMCVFLMTALHDSWHMNEDEYKPEILIEMSMILQMYTKFNIGSKAPVFADVILMRLGDIDLKQRDVTERVSSTVLESLFAVRESLDDFALDALRKYAHLFTTTEGYEELFEVDHSTESCRKMLCCVADPKYSLMQYCCGLNKALQEGDEELWRQTFRRMQAKIFENPFAGSDYQVLFQHKNTLYNIIDYDTTKTDTKQQILSQLISQLSTELKSADRRSLSLYQLCPQLCDGSRTRDRALRKLMNLPMDGSIEFEETVCIYTDTIRRAAVLSVRVGGAARRYIVKGGEPLRPDAAALRLHAAMHALDIVDGGGYRVTPLSEDCGLIEYLEHHERLRTLIMNSTPEDVASFLSSAPSKDSQILCRGTAMEQFKSCCSKVPSYLLRSAIELNSTSVEDFISKKAKFVESLSEVTVVNWLLGVGDRHLENIMYNYRNGAVCNIDWGAMFQYGGTEVPCSRLTRNLLAVCDLQVLESKLQTIVQRMRDNRVLLSAVLNVSFNWMDDFDEKIVYMQGLLNGTTLSYQITKEVLQKSNVKYKEKYIELLYEVFDKDFDPKNNYNVAEQVSCLLRQSTDCRILSVTRSKWEPWL